MQKKQSKADFVRSMPKTMTPAEIIEEGKKQGVTISAANVHATRYADNANGHKAKSGGGAKKTAKKLSKKKSAFKTPAAKKGTLVKTPRVLGKYPNLAKGNGGVLPAPDEAELAQRVVTGLRLLLRQTVREEIKTLMGGVFTAG